MVRSQFLHKVPSETDAPEPCDARRAAIGVRVSSGKIIHRRRVIADVLELGASCWVAYAEGVGHRSPGQADVSATNVRAALGADLPQGIGRASDAAMENALPRPKRARLPSGIGDPVVRAEGRW